MTDAPDPGHTRPTTPAAPEPPANVLLVDDRPSNLLVLRTVLEGLEHMLVTAHSGEEALAQLSEREFAVVLLDVNMPGLDGFETARRIRVREELRHTPIIFVTAFDTDRAQVERAYALGAVDFLFKPLVPVVVRAKVAGFVDLYEKTERLRRQAEHIRRLEQREFEQRLAEENARLRAERERFRVTLRSIGDAVVTTDVNGRITFLNPVAEALTGWTVEEASGRPLSDVFRIVNEATRRPVEDPARRALAEGTVVGLANHTLLIARDGTERPIDDRAAPIWDDGELVGSVLVFRDITARKRAADALRASEERFRILADAMPQIVWTAGPDGQIDYTNRRWDEFTGWVTGARNEAWAAIVHPDDVPLASARWTESLRSGAAFGMELRLRDRHTNSYRWHLLRTVPVRDAAGAVTRWYGTATDIDGQKRAAESARFLAGASAALAAVVDYESTLQRVAVLAVPHFADWAAVDVVGAGGALRRLAVAHREPEKVRLARELHERYPPDPNAPGGAAAVVRTGRPEIVSDITDAMLVAGARDEDHLRLARDLGLRSYVCVPLVVAGKPLGVLTFVTAESGRRYTDTDLALADELARRVAVAIENVRLYQDLREADRRKDEFLALLGHELRNPLAPIRNSVQLLELRPDDPATVARARERIGRQVGQMSRLVDELLDASRIARGKVRLVAERLDLATLVRTAVEDHRHEAEAAGLAVELVVPAAPVWVRGDAARLTQVVGNLFHNAVKFTPSGRITVGLDARSGEAVLTASDTGVGIAAEVLPTLFQAFRQVEADVARSKGGLGLGLAVVRGLVELHGGRVEATSAGPGRGATFTVRLPLGAPVAAPAVGTSADVAPVFGERVVVVEDGVDAAESLAELLEARGFVVALAATGPEGVELCRRVRPEAVVCDLGLPGMSGFDVARALRADPVTAGAVLVAVSGYAQEEDRRQARGAGFDALLAKPADVDELSRLLARSRD